MTQRGAAAAAGRMFVLPWEPDSEIGGVNQAVLNLIRAMQRRGGERPLLLVSGASRLRAPAIPVSCPVSALLLRAPDLPAKTPLRTTAGFLGRLPETLLALRSLLRSEQVRTVECVFPDTECIHFVILRKLGLFSGKLILWFHGNEIHTARQKGRLGRRWMRWLLRGADHIVACSQGLLEQIVQFEPSCRARSSVIYNAIDGEGFRQLANRAEGRLPERLLHQPFLLNVARYEHKKGHDILIRAFEQLAPRRPALLLVMIGQAAEGESAGVRRLVEQSPYRDRLLMLENVPHDQIPAFYRHASVFVLASRREGFPFVLLEAGAVGVPIAATACTGVPELIEDNVTGRLAPVEDSSGLARAIEDLLDDEPAARQMAASLRRRIEERFTWDAVLEQHLAL